MTEMGNHTAGISQFSQQMDYGPRHCVAELVLGSYPFIVMEK